MIFFPPSSLFLGYFRMAELQEQPSSSFITALLSFFLLFWEGCGRGFFWFPCLVGSSSAVRDRGQLAFVHQPKDYSLEWMSRTTNVWEKYYTGERVGTNERTNVAFWWFRRKVGDTWAQKTLPENGHHLVAIHKTEETERYKRGGVVKASKQPIRNAHLFFSSSFTSVSFFYLTF